MNRCCKRVYSGSAFSGHSCQKPGKVERAGKWYCGIHDPEYVLAKRKKNDDEWRARMERDSATREALRAAEEAQERDALRYRHLRELPPAEAQAFFWNFTSRRERDKAIDRAIASSTASGLDPKREGQINKEPAGGSGSGSA